MQNRKFRGQVPVIFNERIAFIFVYSQVCTTHIRLNYPVGQRPAVQEFSELKHDQFGYMWL